MTSRELRGFLKARFNIPLPESQPRAWMLLPGAPRTPGSHNGGPSLDGFLSIPKKHQALPGAASHRPSPFATKPDRTLARLRILSPPNDHPADQIQTLVARRSEAP
jgi:hypothetical protein